MEWMWNQSQRDRNRETNVNAYMWECVLQKNEWSQNDGKSWWFLAHLLRTVRLFDLMMLKMQEIPHSVKICYRHRPNILAHFSVWKRLPKQTYMHVHIRDITITSRQTKLAAVFQMTLRKVYGEIVTTVTLTNPLEDGKRCHRILNAFKTAFALGLTFAKSINS